MTLTNTPPHCNEHMVLSGDITVGTYFEGVLRTLELVSHLVIDNLYVVKGLQRIHAGVPKSYEHQALWHSIYAMRHKIAQVAESPHDR